MMIRKRMRVFVACLCIPSMLIVIGCSQSGSEKPSSAAAPQAEGSAMAPINVASSPKSPQGGPVASEEAPAGRPPVAKLQTVADSQPDRYLIKNATLRVEAKDPRKALERVAEAVKAS